MNLIVNPRTMSRLQVLRKSLPHAVLLTGQPGVGLASIAKELANNMFVSFIEPLDNKQQVNHTSGTIGVDTIRELYDQTRAKQITLQIFIIDDADRMSPAAQAAFLKLLEEPNRKTHFILTSHSPQLLLATIRSRVQAVHIEPASSTQTDAFLDTIQIVDSTKRKQIKYLSDGLPAEIYRLIRDESYFKERAAIMADTRTFLTGTLFEKLNIIQEYQKDRSKSIKLLDSSIEVTKRSMIDAPNTRLAHQLEKLLITRDKINANCSARLQLLHFVVQ